MTLDNFNAAIANVLELERGCLQSGENGDWYVRLWFLLIGEMNKL